MGNIIMDNIDNDEAWQILFYALLESDEKHDWVDLGDGLSCKMFQWDHGELYDESREELFESHYVMCCEYEEEFTAEAASDLLEMYSKWYESLPKPIQCIEDACCWAQVEPFYAALYDCPKIVRAVFENCYWGHYYGDYGFQTLMDNEWNYGLPRELAYELWQLAFWYCAEGCMVEEDVA